LSFLTSATASFGSKDFCWTGPLGGAPRGFFILGQSSIFLSGDHGLHLSFLYTLELFPYFTLGLIWIPSSASILLYISPITLSTSNGFSFAIVVFLCASRVISLYQWSCEKRVFGSRILIEIKGMYLLGPSLSLIMTN